MFWFKGSTEKAKIFYDRHSIWNVLVHMKEKRLKKPLVYGLVFFILLLFIICSLARGVLAQCLIDQWRPEEAQLLLQAALAVSSNSKHYFDKSRREDYF